MAGADDLVLWSAEIPADQWHTNAADGSSSRLTVEHNALRFEFRLSGHGAWTILRRELTAWLPAHYAVILRLRGTATPSELQIKLVDPTGFNVWWWRRPSFAPTSDSQRIVLRKASLAFAWGPLSGGEPDHIGAVELAFAADNGANGSLWIEEIRLEARDPAAAQPTIQTVTSSSAMAGHEAAGVVDGNIGTSWLPDPQDTDPSIELDLGAMGEWGGLIADFTAPAPACRLLASDDGASWATVAESPGGRRRIWLRAEGEGRWLRLETGRDTAIGIAHLGLAPIELAVSPARYCTAIARQAPRGRYPRHLIGEQAYWAAVGVEGGEHKGLLSEDGAFEVDFEGFTLEPFLWTGERLLSWADVEGRLALADDHLPIPSVVWEIGDLRMYITAFAHGDVGGSALVVRYVVENAGATSLTARLFVAIRPFQVNPAWQSLNLVGGISPIVRMQRDGGDVRINDAHTVVPLSPVTGFGAAPSEDGLRALAEGNLPVADSIEDPIGFAEGALAFDLSLAPGAYDAIVVAVPQKGAATDLPRGLDRAAAATWGAERLGDAVTYWRNRLAHLPIELPPSAEPFGATLRASVSWILVNREDARIQPGPRCYRRSWIRDGTLTGTALAEMGFADELRNFLRWYAPYQLPDGRVPCAIDRQGIDQAVEHDSHGQLVWGIVELFRLTGDEAFLRELWPHARRAVDAIAVLRAQRTGDDRRGDPSFGMLPESISHEGYSSHPVHSYWDDFFAVRALADAADAATVLGEADAAELAALRDAMRADLEASIAGTIATHQIDFVPGSVELGDFDPSSTAILLDPCGAAALVPPAALARTFGRYWAEFEARRSGEKPADAYAPYEVRSAAALIMLGQKQRALELLEWLMADQRPPAWRQWPEVAWRDRRAPRFFGDLPHGWIASTFVRTVRRMLAYERADDNALVIAAGIPLAWVLESPGVRARGLPTHFGVLDYSMHADADGRVRVTFHTPAPTPPGGIVIMSPLEQPLQAVSIDGQSVTVDSADRVWLRRAAREVVLA